MNILTRWLTYIHEELPSKARFRTLDICKYRETFEDLLMTCEDIKIPKFYSERIDLGQMKAELECDYIELYLENAGYKQPHEYLLTSVILNEVEEYKRIVFSFTSEYSNWAQKRIIIISPDCKEMYRNDFKTIYDLSWKDYKEGKYQKALKRKAPILKNRP